MRFRRGPCDAAALLPRVLAAECARWCGAGASEALHHGVPLSGTAPAAAQRTVHAQTLRAGAGHASDPGSRGTGGRRSEEHTSELQSRENIVCRLSLAKYIQFCE